jgi:hypothetical protein
MFEKDIFEALKDGLDLLKKYKKLILIVPKFVLYPTEIAKGFKLFCSYSNIGYEIIHGIQASSKVLKGDAYVVVENLIW